jgi:hypothetical protein
MNFLEIMCFKNTTTAHKTLRLHYKHKAVNAARGNLFILRMVRNT